MKKCPVCNGKGEIKPPKEYGFYVPTNRIMAELLRNEGYSIREIMTFLKYKSPHSVQRLFKKS